MLRLELETDEITVLAPARGRQARQPHQRRPRPSLGQLLDRHHGPQRAANAAQGSVYLYREGAGREAPRRHHDPQLDLLLARRPHRLFRRRRRRRSSRRSPSTPRPGRPIGEWQPFVDANGHRGGPDGSVIDAEGYMWNARWGGSCVVRHAPDGSVDRIVEVPVAARQLPLPSAARTSGRSTSPRRARA